MGQNKVKNLAKAYSRLEGRLERHELLYKVPELALPYSVRKNKNGKVLYFNKELLLEMGLINKTESSAKIKNFLLEQFNLQIINEHDRLFHTNFKSSEVKPYSCFATKYLQLQHQNKSGKTSGDGRAIWNGQVSYNGKTWDISSRGTGVTSLAPGVVQAQKPLPTGCTDHGYACGLSELDEIYASIIMSERFYKLGFSTERILACIDIGNGLGICVRASQNLIRPAHLFRYLKLNDHHGVKNLLDYVIDRDYQNSKICFSSNSANAYEKYLNHFTKNFENLCAKAYHQEVFVWLDWDGDNILIDGGIIDYGSIRQFGAHHNKYRYNDIERFSTNLDEQESKAALTVQTFCQLVDFVQTGEKKSLDTFKDHSQLKYFSENVKAKQQALFLTDLGASQASLKKALKWHKKDVTNLYDSYLKLKQTKASQSIDSTDGVNSWPAYNINALLHDLAFIEEKSNLKKYSTEYTSFNHSKVLDYEAIKTLKEQIEILSKKAGFNFVYSGDFKSRLTTAALLHAIDLISQTSEKQKKIMDCINFGFKKESNWIKEIQKLYRDEL